MDSKELRKLFLKYFEDHGHKILPSASLVPENDPTVLFTTAGMHPLVTYLSGEKHPEGNRLASAQKCIRTDDIDEVGDKIHHTFFEMLGNWSLGDYFKAEAIKWSFDFLTSDKGLNLPISRLAVSVFAGDDDAPFDAESYELWQELGFSTDKIAKLPKKNNWWGPAGETGPCGPDTEMFVWTGATPVPDNFQQTCDDPNWVEIWNDVFMQYNKVRNENSFSFEKLKQHNVDTGMGMERALAILNGVDDNYRTDLFWPMIEKIEELCDLQYGESTDEEMAAKNEDELLSVRHSMRIIADHIKAATFAIGDGVIPSNKGAGYIVRRLIRRAIVKAMQFPDGKGIKENFTAKIAEVVFSIYPYYSLDSQSILAEMDKEESKFRKTLANGILKLEIMSKTFDIDVNDGGLSQEQSKATARDIFNLYQSEGFPVELSFEELAKSGILIDTDQAKQVAKMVENYIEEHQELSRTASAGKFKGGLADNKEETTKLHTSAHLLLAGLRKVLGENVIQRGANITEERLRFDFSHGEKMTSEQIAQVEDFVNQNIQKSYPVVMAEMGKTEARDSGAMGVFDDRYGDKVKVYIIGDDEVTISKEICGGPHVANIGALGHFKIKKEESSSAGVRRIKAVLE